MTRAIGVLIRNIWLTAGCLCFSSTVVGFDLNQLVNSQHRQARSLQNEMASLVNQSHSDGLLLPNGQNPTMQELSHTRTVVFLSRSIPESSLLGLLKQGAGRKDVVYVFRGWGNGPVTEMFAYSHKLIKKLPPQVQKNPPQIIVLPRAFKEYRITHAPALMHRDHDGKWYLVQGLRSLEGAVGSIRARQFNIRLSQQYRVTEPDQAEIMESQMRGKNMQSHIEAAQRGTLKLLDSTVELPNNRSYRRYRHTPYVAAAADITNPSNGRVLYPKGTRFNVLALDPRGSRSLVVIDGRSKWQVEYARQLVKDKPDTVVLYTKLGYLADAGLPASPLDAGMKTRLQILGVPAYYRQHGYDFVVILRKAGDVQ